jgi:hypothetical protein
MAATQSALTRRRCENVRTTPRGLTRAFGLLLAVGLPLALVSTGPQAAAETTGRLLVASSPDDGFFGGRQLDADLISVGENDGVSLSLHFTRPHPNGWDRFADPGWGAYFNDVSALEASETYPLDDRDFFSLHDGYERQLDLCPDLDGVLTVSHVAFDDSGEVASLAATFTATCRLGDVAYGSFSYGQEPAPLPPEANTYLLREAKYPTFIPDYVDGDVTTVMAIDVRRHRLLVRWDQPAGFGCATVSAQTLPENTVYTYSGRDDNGAIRGLSPDEVVTVSVRLNQMWDSPCMPSGQYDRSVWPLRVQLREVPAPSTDGTVEVRGRVFLTNNLGYSEPGSFLDVLIMGRRQDGSTVTLGTTTAASDGRYSTTVERKRSARIWTMVRGGAEPTAYGPEPWWYHWSARSEPQRLSGG